jgi:hypothetical protein
MEKRRELIKKLHNMGVKKMLVTKQGYSIMVYKKGEDHYSIAYQNINLNLGDTIRLLRLTQNQLNLCIMILRQCIIPIGQLIGTVNKLIKE